MSSVTHLKQVVQVRRRRSKGFATVDLVNPDGSIRRRDKTLVVQFPKGSQRAATEGSVWRLSGDERENRFRVNEYWVTEYTIVPSELKYLRPSGRILARWISANVKGIGAVIANRLVRLRKLEQLIEAGDEEALRSVAGMSRDRVERLIEAWPASDLYAAIEWLEMQQLPVDLAEQLVDLFGTECIRKVRENPFLLVAMGVSFVKAMELVDRFGLSASDSCVLAGVAQHVTLRHAADTGSTVISERELVRGCAGLLKIAVPENIGEVGTERGLLSAVPGGYQVYGSALMEVAVAQFLSNACCRSPGGWEQSVTERAVASGLAEYETELGFCLSAEQKAAVLGAVTSPVCGISGGAGTGKTTILRAILGIYDLVADGVQCYQVALSGRAAQRMSESTGRPAQTIAKFIVDHLGDDKPNLPERVVVVVDEASMVDLLSMYRLVRILPATARVLFVGDMEQLPPIGAGLVFHALSDTPVPFFHLAQVRRQDEQGGIHRFATSIRHALPEAPPKTEATLADSPDCTICTDASIARLVELWKDAGDVGDCIVLSPIRKGELGVNNINRALQESRGPSRSVLRYRDPLRGWIPWVTESGAQLLLDDRILVTANNYVDGADLRNGDLGVISEVFEDPCGADGAVGVLRVNGREVRVTLDLLEKLDLGYAVTIHKSQGSQWPTCFVMLPAEARKMVDQSLVYTAATRPTKRLILMGDGALIEAAVTRGPSASKRKTSLRDRLVSLMRLEKAGAA